MIIIVSFLIRLFFVRYCANLGAKRVMGGFTGMIYGILFSFFGVLFILSSRRLDDETSNAILLEKFKPIKLN